MKSFNIIPIKSAIVCLLAAGMLASCASTHASNRDAEDDEEITEEVYICTGRHAKVYHSTDNCEGLDRCRADVLPVTLDDAQEMGRRPCKLCW